MSEIDPAVTQAAGQKAVRDASILVAIAAFLVNAILLLIANADRSWAAFGIAIAFGPGANLVIAIVSLVFIPAVRATSKGESILPYVTTCVAAPVAAVVADFGIISLMDLHGC